MILPEDHSVIDCSHHRTKIVAQSARLLLASLCSRFSCYTLGITHAKDSLLLRALAAKLVSSAVVVFAGAAGERRGGSDRQSAGSAAIARAGDTVPIAAPAGDDQRRVGWCGAFRCGRSASPGGWRDAHAAKSDVEDDGQLLGERRRHLSDFSANAGRVLLAR